MSHPTAPISIPNGTYPGTSIVEAVHKSPGGVSFMVRWRVETPFGDFEAEDVAPFTLTFDADKELVFRGADFSRLVALLNAASLPGLPIRRIPDITKLNGIRAEVKCEGGRVVSVSPLYGKP